MHLKLVDKLKPSELENQRPATEEPKPKTYKEDILSVLSLVISQVFLVLAVLFIFRSYLEPGFAGGYETLSQYFKVFEVRQMFMDFGHYIDWSDNWYTGYHQFLFYPPLFYFIAAIVDLWVNNILATSKLMVVLGMIMASSSAFLLAYTVLPSTPKKWPRSLASVFVGLVYAFNPILISIILVRGKPPDFFALAVAPLGFVLLLKWLRSRNLTIPLGLAITMSILMLLHIDTAIMMGLSAFIFAITYLKLDLNGRSNLFDRAFIKPLALLFSSMLVFVGLTAFFWLPYLTQVDSIGALQQLYPSRAPLSPLVYYRYLSYGISRYPGVVLLVLSLLAFAWRKHRVITIQWFVLMITGYLLSLFVYTPLGRQFPALNTIFYYSSMTLVAIATSVLAGLSIYGLLTFDWKAAPTGAKRWFYPILATALKLLILSLIAVIIIFDNSFILSKNSIKPRSLYHSSEIGAINFLRQAKQHDNGRVLFIGPQMPRFTYLPVLINKPVVNGFEVQASRTAPAIQRLISKKLPKRSARKEILDQLDTWNVEYILVDSELYKPELDNLLSMAELKPVFKDDRYQILKFKNNSYIRSFNPMLLISKNRPYLPQVLAKISSLSFIEGQSIFMDDYELDELDKHKVIMIYGFEARDLKETQVKLRQYLKRGGQLIIAMDGSLSNRLPGEEFLGVKALDHTFPKLVNSQGRLVQAEGQVLRNRQQWQGRYFQGLDETWLQVDDRYPVIGVRKYGKGRAIFVGFNFFYHMVLENNAEEYDIFENMLSGIPMVEPPALDQSEISVRPGSRRYRITVKKPTWVMVSMSWSPYWRARVDGNKTTISSARDMVAVNMPTGSHELELYYQRTPVNQVGIVISLITGFLVLGIFGSRMIKSWAGIFPRLK